MKTNISEKFGDTYCRVEDNLRFAVKSVVCCPQSVTDHALLGMAFTLAWCVAMTLALAGLRIY